MIMEDGGESLFSFVAKAHKFITLGMIDIPQWWKICKIIFKQMIECIEFIHKHNICHMDLSLENIVINDISIKYNKSHDHITFMTEDIQIKLCGVYFIKINT